jgi:hypothetical protein
VWRSSVMSGMNWDCISGVFLKHFVMISCVHATSHQVHVSRWLSFVAACGWGVTYGLFWNILCVGEAFSAYEGMFSVDISIFWAWDSPHDVHKCGYQVHFRMNSWASIVRDIVVCTVVEWNISRKVDWTWRASYLASSVSRSNFSGFCHVGTPEGECWHITWQVFRQLWQWPVWMCFCMWDITVWDTAVCLWSGKRLLWMPVVTRRCPCLDHVVSCFLWHVCWKLYILGHNIFKKKSQLGEFVLVFRFTLYKEVMLPSHLHVCFLPCNFCISWCILITVLLVYVLMKHSMRIFLNFLLSVLSAWWPCERMRRYLLWHHCFFYYWPAITSVTARVS